MFKHKDDESIGWGVIPFDYERGFWVVTVCKHENIRWLSGHEDVDITLNGRVVAECLDCEMVAERVSDV